MSGHGGAALSTCMAACLTEAVAPAEPAAHGAADAAPVRPTLVSGGAAGADACWATHGARLGFVVQVASFAGHRRHGPADEVTLLTPRDLARGSVDVQRAAQALGRSAAPRSAYVRQLVARNRLVARAAAVVAVVERAPHRSRRPWDCGVEGGTGWTCQLYLDRFRGAPDSAVLLVYAQDTRQWARARVCHDDVRWHPVDHPAQALALAGAASLAAVGTRKLDASGRAAIQALLGALKAATRPSSARSSSAAPSPLPGAPG